MQLCKSLSNISLTFSALKLPKMGKFCPSRVLIIVFHIQVGGQNFGRTKGGKWCSAHIMRLGVLFIFFIPCSWWDSFVLPYLKLGAVVRIITLWRIWQWDICWMDSAALLTLAYGASSLLEVVATGGMEQQKHR
ncbi:hypothetical protein HOY80DRAFT_527631 [Tuber brumale]|nr:hypothetical protein HOY80DRAFT_527631 [Tuber brumale]